MRHLIIGDIHGRDVWKTVDFSSFDKVVFMGDYLDSFTLTDNQIIGNFIEILDLHTRYPDKIVTLIGNHECHYYDMFMGKGDGYRPSYAAAARIIISDHLNVLKVAYEYNGVLFTHAGVCAGWYDTVYKHHIAPKYGDLPMSEALNHEFYNSHYRLFDISKKRGGIDMFGGPLWAHITELESNPGIGYKQVAGHSHVDAITVTGGGTVTMVDCLNSYKDGDDIMDYLLVLDL